MQSEAEARGYVHRWRADVWAGEVLSFTPDPIQTKFLCSEASDIIINCTRQWGKTTVAGIKAAHKARFEPESEVLVVSATQRQAAILESKAQWALTRASQKFQPIQGNEYEVLEYDPEDGPQIVRRSVLSLELSNGSRIISTPASEDSIRGYSPSMIIVDEDSRVPDALYDALRPMRAAHPCQLILQSTPNGERGHFYREWNGINAKGQKVKHDQWVRFRVPADECPRITKTFLAEELEKMSSDAMYRQEYFCEFINLAGSLFTKEMIDQMTMLDDVAPIARPWLPDNLSA